MLEKNSRIVIIGVMQHVASPVERAIELLGGPTKAAFKLGIKNASVIVNWRARGRIPADKVIEVEASTGISRHDLRPDIFGPAEKVAAE